jgi:DNA-directed RNA polymerase subunit L
MDLDVIEKDGRSIIDMEQNHTLANLIRKAIWANGDEAGYDKGHPLGDESNLVIESDNPDRVLEDAIETSREWMNDIEASL